MSGVFEGEYGEAKILKLDYKWRVRIFSKFLHFLLSIIDKLRNYGWGCVSIETR